MELGFPAAPHPLGASEVAGTRGVCPCLHNHRQLHAFATAADAEPPARGRISLGLPALGGACVPNRFRGSLRWRGRGEEGCRDVRGDAGALPGMGLFGKSCWRP